MLILLWFQRWFLARKFKLVKPSSLRSQTSKVSFVFLRQKYDFNLDFWRKNSKFINVEFWRENSNFALQDSKIRIFGQFLREFLLFSRKVAFDPMFVALVFVDPGWWGLHGDFERWVGCWSAGWPEAKLLSWFWRWK